MCIYINPKVLYGITIKSHANAQFYSYKTQPIWLLNQFLFIPRGHYGNSERIVVPTFSVKICNVKSNRCKLASSQLFNKAVTNNNYNYKLTVVPNHEPAVQPNLTTKKVLANILANTSIKRQP